MDLASLNNFCYQLILSTRVAPFPSRPTVFRYFLRLYLIQKPLRLRKIDFAGKDGSKVTTVVATPGQGPDRPQEVSYSDTKVIGNGSFGVVFQAKLCDNGELVAIKKVLQDKRFKVGQWTSADSLDLN